MRKENACALSPISPFFWLLAGLAALRAANRRLIRETPEKPRSRAQLFGRFCALGTRRSFSLPGKTGAQRGHAPGKNRVRARLKCRHKHGARLAHRRCACVRDAGRKETRCAACPAQPRDLLAAGAGLRRTFSSYLSPFSVWLLPLKLLFICRSGRDGPLLSSEKKVDKDSRGGAVAPPSNPHACALRPISPFFWLLAGLAALRAANRRLIRETLEKQRSRAQLFKRFCASGMRRGFCPTDFLPSTGNRNQAFSLPGKTGAQRGHAPGKNRVRARLGASKNTVRELPTAGAGARRGHAPGKNRVRARLKCRHKHGARLAHRRCAHRRRNSLYFSN